MRGINIHVLTHPYFRIEDELSKSHAALKVLVVVAIFQMRGIIRKYHMTAHL